MAPPSLDMLHLASARRSTFNKSRKGQNRALNWPYPLTAAAAKSSTIHPDRLVEAGFYCTPTVDDPTVTTCYLCEIVVGQWEEGEDPLYRHEAAIEEAGIRCAYLDVWNQSWSSAAVETSDDDEGAYLASVPQSEWSERWSGDGAEYHPRSERMHDARLATFRLGWPHEGAARVPTKEDIAAAGWVFRPGADDESEDQCACIYCGRTVEGWEEGDDPVALHRRKIGLKCPFFIADDPPAAGEAVAEAQTDAEPAQEEEQQQQPEEEEEEEEEPEPIKPKRGTKKASVAPSASSTIKKVVRGPSTKKKGKESLREADREDDNDDEQEDPTPTAAAAAPDSREEEDADEEELAPKATKKGKAKAAPKKSAAARPTTTRSTRAKTTPAVSEAEDVPEQADVSVMRKSTRARAASNASTASSVPPPRTAALSKSTRSRAPAPSTSTAAESSEVEKRAPLDVFTAEESTEVEIVKPKRTSKKAQQPKKTVVARATSDEGTSPDDSLAQLALIADAALEAQGPAAIEEEAPMKKSKKPSPSAASSTSSSSSGGKAKKGKKADAESPIEVDAPIPNSPKEVAMQDEAPEPIAAASAPTSPRAAPDPAPLSANRPIRSLPSNKSSKSPSSATRALVSSSTAAPPPPLPSASSSQSSLPTSAFETASERLSAPAPVPTVVDPAAPFVAPTNPFAGSSLLSLVPPPTQHELDSHTVAEWYTLCYDRIRARFENENAALRNHLEARLDLGRNKLRDMADDAKAREDREAAEDAENRRRLAKERKERIGASGGGTRSAVKAGGAGGSTRKMR